VITLDDLAGKLALDLRSAPFSWAASTWFGSKGDNAALDLTRVVNDSAALTERGEDIVNGKGGLKSYVVPISNN
jgi:hypothetical protein